MKEALEKYQVFVYLVTVSAGLGLGVSAPDQAGALAVLVWPALGMLLYVTITQTPLLR